MAEGEGNRGELYLKVFLDRSELVRPDGTVEAFPEGLRDAAANTRYRQIATALEGGFLQEQIDHARAHAASLVIPDADKEFLDQLVASLTSNTGRAIVGLTLLQLCVKAIVPAQSIRLHKGGTNTGDFSWRQGISMRNLDKNFITPVLRHNNLLKLNADGFMMTRSLAENYPYTPVYKARMQGGQDQWMGIVEAVERGEMNPKAALTYLIGKLINRSDDFVRLGAATDAALAVAIGTGTFDTQEATRRFIWRHITGMDYAARLMEVAMHSLMQAVQEVGGLDAGELRPLTQMRNANKKHGNIGDVEVVEFGQIKLAWDAKYGQDYLRDQIEELDEKLAIHPDVLTAGFVTSVPITRREEIAARVRDVEAQHDVEIEIVTFDEWVAARYAAVIGAGLATETEFSRKWMRAYTESLALQRPLMAPIDEPCDVWLAGLATML